MALQTGIPAASCELCAGDGGPVLWRDGFCRVVRVLDEDYPGFCRVVLERHVAEMTDLAEDERARLMRAVFACETALREAFAPEKMNLASLGNRVAHLHWHVIARHREDAHFPDPVWAAKRRGRSAARPPVGDAALAGRLAALLDRPR